MNQMKRTMKCCWLLIMGFAVLGYSRDNSRVTWPVEHKKVQLWEGGPYWAETNIGAEKPWEYGYYFWWGDTVGYKRVNNVWVASDGSSSAFSFDPEHTPTHNKDISSLRRDGWITTDGVLTPEHDVAHVQWGGGWRMPTHQELIDLKIKCDWSWSTMNGVTGSVVRGRGDYASVSIFLPAAGSGSWTLLSDVGSYGRYWSSVPRTDSRINAWGLLSNSGFPDVSYDYRYDNGHPVRPVQTSVK